MSVHIESLPARETSVQVMAPGADWVGAEDQPADRHVLTLAGDDVTAIVGTLDELIALTHRINRRINAAAARTPGTAVTLAGPQLCRIVAESNHLLVESNAGAVVVAYEALVDQTLVRLDASGTSVWISPDQITARLLA